MRLHCWVLDIQWGIPPRGPESRRSFACEPEQRLKRNVLATFGFDDDDCGVIESCCRFKHIGDRDKANIKTLLHLF